MLLLLAVSNFVLKCSPVLPFVIVASKICLTTGLRLTSVTFWSKTFAKALALSSFGYMDLDKNNLTNRNKFLKGFWVHQSSKNQWQFKNEILQVLSLTILKKA